MHILARTDSSNDLVFRPKERLLVFLAKRLGYTVVHADQGATYIAAGGLENAEQVEDRITAAYVRTNRIYNVATGITGILFGLGFSVAWLLSSGAILYKVFAVVIGVVFVLAGRDYSRYYWTLPNKHLSPSRHK